MEININKIDYNDTRIILDALCVISSRKYLVFQCRQFEYFWNVQLHNFGYQDFNNLWEYTPQPGRDEFDILLKSFYFAQTYKDQLKEQTDRSLDLYLFGNLETYIHQAFREAFHVRVRNIGHAYSMIRENWLDLPRFKTAMIHAYISQINDSKIRRIHGLHEVAIGDFLRASILLWKEACRRWPSLRKEKIEPQFIQDFIVLWFRQTEIVIGEFR